MNKTALLTTLALSSSLVAQYAPSTKTTIKTATTNGFAVRAGSNYGSGSLNFNSIANGTDISRGRSIRATSPNSKAYASSYPRYVRDLGSGAALYDSGWASSSSGNYTGHACSANGSKTKASCSAHSVLAHFAVPENETVTVVAYYSGKIRGNAAGGGMIDVGNDGKVEMTIKNTTRYTTTKKEFVVKAGKNGISVKLTTAGEASNKGRDGASYESYARVYIKRKTKTITCTITAYDEKNDPNNNPKSGCAGDLAGTTGSSRYSRRWISLNLTNAAKSKPAIWVFGVKPLQVNLPGTKCKLLVDPTNLVGTTTSSMGTSRRYLTVNSSTVGTTYVQALTLDISSKGVAAASSNGLKIECKSN